MGSSGHCLALAGVFALPAHRAFFAVAVHILILCHQTHPVKSGAMSYAQVPSRRGACLILAMES
jgi:hypothetical protein